MYNFRFLWSRNFFEIKLNKGNYAILLILEHTFTFLKIAKIFNWSLIDLQYYTAFRYAAQWSSIFIDYTPSKVITENKMAEE